MKVKCEKCGHQNIVNMGAVLGSRTSEAKRDAARINASKPPRPGSRPRGNPGTWTSSETEILKRVIEQFDGRPSKAYAAHPEWRKKLFAEHTEAAIYKKLYFMKQGAEPEMITPPLPPPPSDTHRTARRTRGGAVAPKSNSRQ